LITLLKALDIFFYVSLIVAIGSAPLLLFFGIPYLTSRGNEKTRIGIGSIAVFSFSVLAGLAAAGTSGDIGHREVLRNLEAVKPPCRILINGKTADNADVVLATLQTLDWLPARHSNPTKRINREITDHAPHLILSPARDSGDPQEYWVYYPRFYCPFGQTHCLKAEHDIARIKSSLFDGY